MGKYHVDAPTGPAIRPAPEGDRLLDLVGQITARDLTRQIGELRRRLSVLIQLREAKRRRKHRAESPPRRPKKAPPIVPSI
jgi:hypothetical protein